jgi:enoyl-CoA hydratase
MTFVRVEVSEGVGVVTLDDPERRNALSGPMVDEIVAAFDEMEADESVGAVVVTGAPPAFCAGADTTSLGKADRPGLNSIYDGFLRVARSTLPTIAAVNGAAVGAGVNLALVCDVRLAGRSSRFDTRFLKLGLHPGGGHTWMMRRVAGPQTAAATILFGEVLDGEAAARSGLAWKCFDDESLLDEARTMAGRAAAAPRALVQRTKRTLARMADVDDHDEAVAIELEVQVWSMQQPDFKERLQKQRQQP